MNDSELDNGSDHEVSENHAKLLDAVSKLDKRQSIKTSVRNEPTANVSEFHLVRSGIADKDAVRAANVASLLGRKGHHANISKKFKNSKQNVLSKPLEKPAAEKLKRIVGFENTKKELEAWNAIVSRNRTAEYMRFPLNQPSMRLEPTDKFVTRFRLQSELEKELAALEPPKPKEEEAKPDDFPLTVAELLAKRKEAAKLRAQQSYKEAKAFRQNKIKSKKFHRIQRKERIKKEMKEFEELQKTDPAAALEKLEQLDKTRAEERMSLRHKSTGQWAKSKQVRAKYDKESRKVLAEQLSIGKTLTQKIQPNQDSDDDEEAANQVLKNSASEKDNPWVNGTKTTTEIDDFVSSYRKYWENKNGESTEKNPPNGDDSTTTMEKINDTDHSNTSELPKTRRAVNPVVSVEEFEPQNGILKNNKTKASKVKESIKTTVATVIKNKSSVSEKSIKPNVEMKKSNASPEVYESEDEMEVAKRSPVVNKKLKKLNKKTAKIDKSGTSKWLVESLSDESPDKKKRPRKTVCIDDLFDDMEDTLTSRIDRKLKNVARKLASNAAACEKLEAAENHRHSTNSEYSADLSFKKRKLRPEIDEEMDESTGISGNQAIRKKLSVEEDLQLTNGLAVAKTTCRNTNSEIDPNKFIKVKPKHLKTRLPDTITGGDEALDDSEADDDQRDIISEAFADDDVVDEFRKEKAQEVKNSQPEDLDLRLPGWGSWGGSKIVSSRRKRRFIMKFPKEAPRRDENKGDVIIIEETDPKIKEHQVSELPYPFTSVKDFEASIRAPIGRNFVPENAHRRFIAPAVKTKIGEIIEPMDIDALVSKKEKPTIRTKQFKSREKKPQRKINPRKTSS